jgi:hypothetical protein
MRRLTFAFFLLVPFASSVSPAQAALLTFAPTPAGLTFTIENQGEVTDLYPGDGTSDTYAILLTLTTSTSYVDSDNPDYLAAFSVNFGDGSLDGLTLAGSPLGYSWVLKPSDEVAGNSAKCGGDQPGAGCVEEASSGTNLTVDANATYSWLFHVDVGSIGFADATMLNVGIATLKSDGSWHPGSNFAASTGSLAPADSGTGDNNLPPGPPDPTPLPEPGSLVLLGSGLLFAASRMRRGKK